MEGTLYYYKGLFKGYKKLYGLIEPDCNVILLFDKAAYDCKPQLELVLADLRLVEVLDESSRTNGSGDSKVNTSKSSGHSRRTSNVTDTRDNTPTTFYTEVFRNDKESKGFIVMTMRAPAYMVAQSSASFLMSSKSNQISKERHYFKCDSRSQSEDWITAVLKVLGKSPKQSPLRPFELNQSADDSPKDFAAVDSP